MRLVLPAAVLAVSTLLVHPARADKASAALDVSRSRETEQCMSAAELRGAVEARLGRRVFVATGGDLRVEVRYERRASSWRALLLMRNKVGDALGERELSTGARHCSALDASLALVVALLVDIDREQAAPPTPQQPPAPEPAITLHPTPLELPRDTIAPRAPWRFEIALLGAIGLGLLPGLAGGGVLRVAVDPPSFLLTQLDVTFWPGTEMEFSPGGSQFRLATLGLFICPVVWRGNGSQAALCAGQRLGSIKASGFGFDRNTTTERLVYSLGVRAEGGLSLIGPLLAKAGVGLEIPLVRDEFVVGRDDVRSDDLFRMWPAIVTLEAGLGVRF